MNYTAILAILTLLLGMSHESDSFNGFDFTFNTKIMENFHENIIKGFLVFLEGDYDPFQSSEKIWVLNFNITTSNINSKATLTESTKPITSFKDGLFNAIFTNPFDITLSFEALVTVGGITIGQGKGTTKVFQKIETYTDYSQEIPTIAGKIELTAMNTKFSGSIFSEAIIELISSHLKTKLEPDLNSLFTKFCELEDPLNGFESSIFTVNFINYFAEKNLVGHSIVESELNRKTNINIDGQSLFHDCSNPYVPSGKIFEYCVCKYVFPGLAIIRGYESQIELSKWDLVGKVMELYEILPELINEYPPDLDFIVKKSFIEMPEPDSIKINYNFIISDTSVLLLTTSFSGNLEASVTNGYLNAKFSEVSIKKIETNVMIQPIGRVVLARLMNSEIADMKANPIFDGGLEIPDDLTSKEFCLIPK